MSSPHHWSHMSTPLHWIAAVVVIFGSSALTSCLDGPDEIASAQAVSEDLKQAPADARVAMKE